MNRIAFRFTLLLAVFPASALRAQDEGSFTLLRGDRDTLATEQFSRDSTGLAGTLVRPAAGGARERVKYRVTVAGDGSIPLIELAAWRAGDPVDAAARQNTRLIFKDDSVAIDEANGWNGVSTALLQSARGALPYLNLSSAFLELAVRRVQAAGRDSLTVPFFNLGGGQTVTGTVRRVGLDSATIQIGTVQFRLRVDPTGRILGGVVPSQGLTIARGAAR